VTKYAWVGERPATMFCKVLTRIKKGGLNER
jgi:hypothetical protein